ncbi:MAG: hypothetical protein HY909_14315 [Deltaproteobacteria bacterium]|nr:hypothetical protein [Deltaproteobacteria bacterium]
MFAAGATLLIALTTPLDLRAPDLPHQALVPTGEALAQSPWALNVNLRSRLLGESGALRRDRWLAQAATQVRTDATPPPAGAPGAAPSCDEGSAEGPCTVDRTDYNDLRASEATARYTLRRRRASLTTHRAFALAAWGSFLVTEVFGTLQALNQPTWFGDGACRTMSGCVGGDFASHFTDLHAVFAFTTVGLYTTAGVIAVTTADPDRESEGPSTHASTLRLHKILAWVHAGGMIALPILGLLTTRPTLILGDNATSDEIQSYTRTMRSLHMMVGYTTFAAFTFAGALEIF